MRHFKNFPRHLSQTIPQYSEYHSFSDRLLESLEGEDAKQYVTLRFAERFEHKFSDRAKVWQTAEWLPRVDEFDNYVFNFELGASAAITKSVDLRVVFQDSYRTDPADGRKRNDMKLIAGVGYRF